MKSKIRFVLSLVLLVFFFSACEELNIISYEVAPGKVTFEVYPTDSPDSLYVFDSMGIDITPKLEEFGIDKSIIKQAKVKKITFELISPDTSNFNWADYGSVTISTEDLPPMVIGEISSGSIPSDVQHVVININSDDLSEYLKAPSFDMHVEAKNKELINEIHTIDVDVTYLINI